MGPDTNTQPGGYAGAPKPADEEQRLASLHALGILDTPPEEAFDDITRLAAAVCGTPTALVSFVDADRQWFKSRVGVEVEQTPRAVALCAFAILERSPLVVPDARADPRFAGHPAVTGAAGLRFYAGAQVASPEGFCVGTVCVTDTVPRELSTGQRENLAGLARQVAAELLLRRQAARLGEAEAALRSSESRFHAFMDGGPAVAFVKDDRGRFAYVNRPLLDRFGTPAEHWLGRTDAELWPREVSERFAQTDRAAREGGRTLCVDERVPTAAGERHWRSYKFPYHDGGRVYLACVALDVTAQKVAEEALRTSEAKFRSTVDRLAEGVFIVDAGTKRHVEANAALLAMLGYTLDEFLALDRFAVAVGETAEEFARNIAEAEARLAADGRCDVGRRRFRRKDGRVVPVDLRVSLVPNGRAGLHAVIVRDVTEQAEYEERLLRYQSELEGANARLHRLAVTDHLTGIPNRVAFAERLGLDYARAARTGRPFSLLMVDIDHFKLFNDAHGHLVGDRVLCAVAATLQHTARTSDFLARYGGEEFVVLLPDAEHAGAMAIAERFRRAVAAIDCPERSITISIGAATRTADTPDAESLLREADAALYVAKRAGRNRAAHGGAALVG